MSQKLRIAFMGSPDFSVPVLAALIDAGHEIACVYSQPPRPAAQGDTGRNSESPKRERNGSRMGVEMKEKGMRKQMADWLEAK